ncbi:MAG: histidine kinase [Gammaproteobacteria bacterium MedPE]|nr:MAG: histidine kinase [Gammaproteobacteria bacterium MedPE]
MFEFWRFKARPIDLLTSVSGDYNYFLVFLSFLISFLAAYALLVVLERAWQATSNKTLRLWKIFGSIVFGLGVWAMHFTGMLAFMLPIPMRYDGSLTLLSIFTPILFTYLSINILALQNFTVGSIQRSALFLALGIGSMHFIGMEAMKSDAVMSYEFSLFMLSIVVAYILATIAVYLIKTVNKSTQCGLVLKTFCSIVMGSAVALMHYVAMSAVNFNVEGSVITQHKMMNEHAVLFALVITGVVFVIVATTILCVLVDERLNKAKITIEENAIREKSIVEQMADGLLTMNASGVIESANSAANSMFGREGNSLVGLQFNSLMNDTELDKTLDEEQLSDYLNNTVVTKGIKKDGTNFPIEINFSKILVTSLQQELFNCVVRDISQRVLMEGQLRQSQKLESMGQLSAGIAHEINTPTQYVSDNIMFLNTAFENCLKIIEKAQVLTNKQHTEITQQELEDIHTIFVENDIDFIISEIPLAVTQSIEGLQRVKKIIGAMKSFSHSNQGEMSRVNIVEAIESTIIISRSEWRYIAELKTQYAEELPYIKCLRDEFNQVILNFIVNAAHAIEEKYSNDSAELGQIYIEVSSEDDSITIIIKDDGIGMSSDVKEKIFSPFYTTKGVGKGTGQGLSLAYSVIVEKHKGSITVTSEPMMGTTFNIMLPVS